MLYSLFSFLIALFEITLIAAAFYFLYIWMRTTRAVQVLNGFVILFIAYLAARFFGMHTISWLLEKMFALSVVAFLILFQPELRRALAQIGRRPFFWGGSSEDQIQRALVQAVETLSQNKTGALVAIQRDIGLGSYLQTGVKLDARVTPELLVSIFHPRTPLHDGGAVIVGDRLVAAGCVFPLSQALVPEKKTGTRHRAAVGLSEETDALVIVVSEETGKISAARGGILSQDLTPQALAQVLIRVRKKDESIEIASPAHP